MKTDKKAIEYVESKEQYEMLLKYLEEKKNEIMKSMQNTQANIKEYEKLLLKQEGAMITLNNIIADYESNEVKI